MSVDAKVILPSNPGPQEIAVALHAAFGCEVKIVEASSGTDWSFFYALFPDPDGRGPADAPKRQLAIFLGGNDDRHVYDGKSTQCHLGKFGGSSRVVDALVDAFGGYVLYDDSKGDWTFRDRKEPEAGTVLDDVSPRDRLRIEIERAVGPSKAAVLASIADDAEALEAVMEAYGRFRSSDTVPSAGM